MMSSIVQPGVAPTKGTGRRYEHVFFSGMSVLIAIIVFIGFSRTYYLAPVFHPRPLPSVIVHIHGAVFTCWILLLVVQTSLISAHRVEVHRALGIFGACVAVLTVALGLMAANDSILLRHRTAPGFDPKTFYAIPISELVGFAVPVFFAMFYARRNPSVHKRLILIATIAMMTAAFGRWPVGFLLHKPVPAMLCSYSLFVLLAGYDLLSTRRVHRVTIAGSLFVILVEMMSYPVGRSAAWHAFASWMQSWGI
jgi:hypothetical protein